MYFRHPSVCTFRSVGPSIEVLVFPMTAPLWRTGLLSISLFADTYTTVHQLAYLSHSSARPSRPTNGDLCCFSIGRFVCGSLSTGLSVEACVVLFYSLPVARPSTIHSAPYISRPYISRPYISRPYISRPLCGGLYCTFYQPAPSWRLL